MRDQFRSFALLLIEILILPAGLLAQNDACTNRTIAASVITQDGKPITDLSAADFRAELRGKPIPVSSATYDNGPRRVLILLDTSTSMTGRRRPWDATMLFTTQIVQAAPPSMSLSLATFSSSVDRKIGFTLDRNPLTSELSALRQTKWDEVKRRGGTAIRDGLETSIRTLQPYNFGDAIVLVTDGDDTSSMERDAPFRRFLAAAGVKVFVIEPAHQGPRRISDPNNLNLVPEAARVTGGDYVTFPWDAQSTMSKDYLSSMQVAALYLIRQISSVYRIELTFPEPIDKLRELKLTLASKRQANVLLRFPPQIGPCQ
jgi:hypothetical protein